MYEHLPGLGLGWAEAERAGDIATLDDMLAEDFVGIGPLGFMLSKRQWLDRYRSGDLVHLKFIWEGTRIRTYGAMAILIGIQTQETSYQGHVTDFGRFRSTMIAIEDGDHWRLALIHLSNLDEWAG